MTQGKNYLGVRSKLFPSTLSPLLPRHPLSSHAPFPGNWDSWYPSNSLTVACWLCHQAVHLLEHLIFFLRLIREMAKVLCIVFLKVHYGVCVCVRVPKSGETIRTELDLLNEPRGDAEFMCFHLQLGEAWRTDRQWGGGRVGYLWFCWSRYPGCYWASWPTCSFFRKKWILSMGETQASDLLLGALIKGLS